MVLERRLFVHNNVDISRWVGQGKKQVRKTKAPAESVAPPAPPADCAGIIYQVVQGDTLFNIAQRYGITLSSLILANPQITNPNNIVPGQRICVPVQRQVTGPCCTLLKVASRELAAALEPFAGGVVRVYAPEPDFTVITIAVVGLPAPDSFGEFDTYLGSLRQTRGDESLLYSTILNESEEAEDRPVTWAGSRRVPGLLEPQDLVFIRPYNQNTGVAGDTVLTNNLANCLA
jgi:spore coat assembly protein SafA